MLSALKNIIVKLLKPKEMKQIEIKKAFANGVFLSTENMLFKAKLVNEKLSLTRVIPNKQNDYWEIYTAVENRNGLKETLCIYHERGEHRRLVYEIFWNPEKQYFLMDRHFAVVCKTNIPGYYNVPSLHCYGVDGDLSTYVFNVKLQNICRLYVVGNLIKIESRYKKEFYTHAYKENIFRWFGVTQNEFREISESEAEAIIAAKRETEAANSPAFINELKDEEYTLSKQGLKELIDFIVAA